MPDAAIIIMMTRWHEDDLAGRILNHQDGWEVLELPAISGEDTDKEQALWPEWYNLDALREVKQDIAEREWQALYQQKPTADHGSYCKREWFEQRYTEAPENLRTYIASDYAVTEHTDDDDTSRGPDYTEHGVFGVAPDGHVYVLDWWSGRTTPEEWVESLLDLCERWSPQGYYAEAGVIRRAVEPLLARRIRERKVWLPISNNTWMPSMSDKAARGRSFQGRASMGRWHFPVAPWADRVIEQCVGFPGAMFDDAFDTCSLFGRAADTAEPGYEAPKPARRVRDRYADNVTRGTWKTA